ncbi:hypothetical protein D920_02573 [Enterococcus faecalis 13-SD-W-01]|nr:hypothetical protein D920_02573 [Enterococcus faecalis 13-SD-W-01]
MINSQKARKLFQKKVGYFCFQPFLFLFRKNTNDKYYYLRNIRFLFDVKKAPC